MTWLPYHHHVEVLFNNTFTEVTIRLESGRVHTYPSLLFLNPTMEWMDFRKWCNAAKVDRWRSDAKRIGRHSRRINILAILILTLTVKLNWRIMTLL